MKGNRAVRTVKMLMMGIVAVLVFGFATMLLWNWLMPALFGLATIGFWKALGLVVLGKILFGGFRGGSHGPRWRWERMSPEEREKMRAGMKGCCCGSEPKSEA